MQPSRLHWKNATCRIDRSIAHMAHIAWFDANFGGAKALTILDKLTKSPHHNAYVNAVTEAYHSTTGISKNCSIYECPECGSAVLGLDNAYSHCQSSYDETDDYEDPEQS